MAQIKNPSPNQANLSSMPGNWSPLTWYHDIETGADHVIGSVSPAAQSFETWVVGGPVGELTAAAAATASTVLSTAASDTASFVSKTTSGVTSAVTGAVSLTKWVVIGLLALAVIYFLAVASPLLSPLGRK